MNNILLNLFSSSYFHGECLIAGQLGKTFIFSAIIALIAGVVVSLKSNKDNESNLKSASAFYWFHLVFLFGAVLVFYYIILTHKFEYSYVWRYTSKDTPLSLLISSFWAGQEGSFLFWAFVQAIVGAVLLLTAKELKRTVMMVFSIVQILLISMMLGIDIKGFVIGVSPFQLLREVPENIKLDFFHQVDYLSKITDGNGLNPLLQNVWMIVHPPVLFVGYAVSLVPYSYALASLIEKDYQTWLKPTRAWTRYSLVVLGLGIILGGRWAYESLTFGGFWAWDPVENASLVPWLLLLASMHMLVLTDKKKRLHTLSYLLVFLSYFFIIYATYLTRSGVLGQTSVHSFGVNVLSPQMVVLCLLALLIPIGFLVARRKTIPNQDVKDKILSREFWLIIGVVFILVSAFQIILTTSLPVINNVFNINYAPPVNPVQYYNQWQLPLVCVIFFCIFISVSLKYGKNDFKAKYKSLLLQVIISLIVTSIIFVFIPNKSIGYFALMFFSVLISVGGIYKLTSRYSFKKLGANISHIGTGIFMLGVIIAFGQSKIMHQTDSNNDNSGILLTKGKDVNIGNYIINYSESHTERDETFYRIDFKKSDSNKSFSLYPSVNANPTFGSVYNPDVKHFLSSDIYTYILQYSQNADGEKYDKLLEVEKGKGDTIIFDNTKYVINDINVKYDGKDIDNLSICAVMSAYDSNDSTYTISPCFNIVGGIIQRIDSGISGTDTFVRFENVADKSTDIVLGFYKKTSPYILVKMLKFPFIILVWSGVTLLFAGVILSGIKKRNHEV
ncbi:MAG: cytochrome c biogenesis protein CcsA [Bacteroidales bacterium]